MISFLGAEEGAGTGGSGMLWILLVLLAVLIVAYIFSYFKRKKYNQETTNMLNSLRPGDKVKTYSGFYGTVVSIRETTDGKVVTLETGDDDHKSYTTIDSNAIYCIDKKEDIVYDTDGNVVMPASEEEKQEALEEAATTIENDAEAENAEAVDDENAESESDEAIVVVEEEPVEKKKTTKKRTTK